MTTKELNQTLKRLNKIYKNNTLSYVLREEAAMLIKEVLKKIKKAINEDN